MAVKYLAGERIIGTAAERAALTVGTVNYADSVGNTATLGSNGATIESSPTPPSGLGSTCINFDGANDYLDGYGIMRAMNTAGSISLWFNQDQENEKVLMFFGESNGETMVEIKTRSDRRIGINVVVDGTDKWAVATTEQYNAFGNWNHLVITHNGTVPKIYLNGSLTTDNWAIETDKTVWWTAIRAANANNFTIGCKALYNDGSRGDEFNGQMTDIAFWDTELPIGANSSAAGSIKYLYDDGDGRLASTIPTDQTAYYQSPSALEDGTYILENYGATWATGQSQYAFTSSADNNYNGIFLNTNSCIKGRVLKTITAYLCKTGSPNTSGTIKLGVWDNTNGGTTITPVANTLVEIQDDLGGLNTGYPAVAVPITVTLPTTRTLEEYDTIALELTGGNYNNSNNIAWNYSDGVDFFDGGASNDVKFTTRNRATGGTPTWTGVGMTSDMHCTITTDSDSIKNHGGIGGTTTYVYPDLINGTIFEESDTGKHYMFDGSQTWNEM